MIIQHFQFSLVPKDRHTHVCMYNEIYLVCHYLANCEAWLIRTHRAITTVTSVSAAVENSFVHGPKLQVQNWQTWEATEVTPSLTWADCHRPTDSTPLVNVIVLDHDSLITCPVCSLSVAIFVGHDSLIISLYTGMNYGTRREEDTVITFN